MVLNALDPIIRTYHFDNSTAITGQFTSNSVTSTVSFTAGGDKGVSLTPATSGGYSFVHFGDNLVFDIDNLLFVEYLYQITAGNHASVNFYLGMASAFNADPDAVAASVWFAIKGTAETVCLETDDGVIDNNDIPCGLTVTPAELHCARIDFASGIQSISPPSRSLGGKGSIQFTHTDNNQVRCHLNKNIDRHMSMVNYTGKLQPYFGLIDSSSTPAPALFVKQLKIGYRELTY